MVGVRTDDRSDPGTADNMNGQYCMHNWIISGVQTDDNSVYNVNIWNCWLNKSFQLVFASILFQLVIWNH